MLDALIGVVAGLLILAGVLVILGPQTMTMLRRIRGLRRSRNPFAALQAPRKRDPAVSGLHPKTQRVLASATRLAAGVRGPSSEHSTLQKTPRPCITAPGSIGAAHRSQ